jgi:shikimate kinase
MKHIILIGMPGAGKTWTGERLAAKLNIPFTDTDAEVEKRAAMPISELIGTEGEGAFRLLEAEVLAEALLDAPSVIATGGGLPTQTGAMDALLDAGTVIWLNTSPGVALERIAASITERPLLAKEGMTPRVRWAELLNERVPIYALAHIHIAEVDKLFALLDVGALKSI